MNRLIGEVARRNGIRLDRDDPAFALVSLNQLVLEETASQLMQQFRTMAGELQASFDQVEDVAARHLARNVREAAAEVRREIQGDLNAASLRAQEIVHQVHQAHTRPVIIRWLALGLFLGLLIFAAGLVIGRTLLYQ